MSIYRPLIDPQSARVHYSRFLMSRDILLDGHSHRAWPDCTLAGHMRSFNLAIEHGGHKWGKILGELVPQFQRLVASRIGINDPTRIAWGPNTHNFVFRIFSCFLLNPTNPLRKIVSTDGEFHSLARQLNRFEEAGIEIVRVPTKNKEQLVQGLIDAIDGKTTVVALSTVFFIDGYMLRHDDIRAIIEKARKVGATVILDLYHHFNIREINLDALGKDIFAVGGGYKYGQVGEGAAWLVVPEDCKLRPLDTGWFADFDSLERFPYPSPIQYGPGGNRFLEAAMDFSAIGRQVAVFDFMDQMGWTVEVLARNNLTQTHFLMQLVGWSSLPDFGVQILSSENPERRGPFVALDLGQGKNAESIAHVMYVRANIRSDGRGSILRLGPWEGSTEGEMKAGLGTLLQVLTEQA